jgi:hypothetical protein
MTHCLALVLAVEAVADTEDSNYDAINATVDSVAIVHMGFLGLLRAIQISDGILFDILAEQEDAPLQFTRAKGLLIDDLSNTAALKMTRFNWYHLHCLYTAFDLEGRLEPMKDKLAFLTRHKKNSNPCYYRIHPEEVFLFTRCRLATGFSNVHIVDSYISGDTNYWTYAYPWMLKYLDKRYLNIIGHQGLTCFFPMLQVSNQTVRL